MAGAFFVGVILAAFLVGLGLRLRGKHWFRSWLFSSLVIPISVSIVEFFQPSGWYGVALFIGTLYGVASGGIGVLIGWLATRKRHENAAS